MNNELEKNQEKIIKLEKEYEASLKKIEIEAKIALFVFIISCLGFGATIVWIFI